MDLAYVDESGNSGYGASHTYTLGCVLVNARQWPTAFEGYLGFRRMLKNRFGLLLREEVKANHLVRNSGAFGSLKMGDEVRRDVYRMYMRLPVKLQIEVMSVVIQKDLITKRDRDPRDIAWEFLFQRLERRSTTSGNPVMLIHDEGEAVHV